MSDVIVRVVRRMLGRPMPWFQVQRGRTDFLFAQPSFLSGVARVIDLGGTFDAYNISRTPAQADALALGCDWVVIGDDFVTAARSIYPEFPAPPTPARAS